MRIYIYIYAYMYIHIHALVDTCVDAYALHVHAWKVRDPMF